jgi:pyruvate-ferredoxin/flavodoxin oxidoreductase
MKRVMTIDGNEACSRTAYMFTEVSGIYPITPSSPMAEHIDEWSSKDIKNIFNDEVKVIEMQSEAGAAGMVHGSLEAGLLTTTFTASQGLLLMIPNMYKIAGEMLPCVIHVAARSLASHALSIFGDHQDIYATRMTGFCMLASSSVQDATYMAAIAHLASIKSSLPFLHFFDGFRTSHEINKIEVLELEDMKKLVDYEAIQKFRNKALNPLHPEIKGTAQNDDIYFQALEVRNKFYDEVPSIVEHYMKQINELAGTDYKPFNYYGSPKAKHLIIAMGSVCGTIREVIDALDEEIGLVEVHLYRPFDAKSLKKVIPATTQNIAVLDRTKEPGSQGEPLYLDVVAALKSTKIQIVGGRYGLSSKNTPPSSIKAVYDMLKGKVKEHFTIGIDDDVTYLSLKEEDFKLHLHDEYLIYGYGSDGMVSAGKSLIKLIGDNTNKYVQGYFQYDSKKSGGVTIGHLRFSDQKIYSTYYVENPKVVVVTKDSYLESFDTISSIRENGIFIVNTIKTEEEFKKSIPDNLKVKLIDKHIKVYTINAYELARKVGLQNKISTIMETVMIYLSKMIDFDFAKKQLKEYMKDKFFKKGDEVLQANYEAVDLAIEYLKEISLEDEIILLEEEKKLSVFEMMEKRKGNELKTSDFLNRPDGSFECGTAALEKRCISDIVPKWIHKNCLECNQCSFICPHGVIRPFLLDEEEYNKAPNFIKEKCLVPVYPELRKYHYVMGISVADCTGCGLCMKNCPGKKEGKALIPNDLELALKEKEQKSFDFLVKNVKEKKEIDKTIISGSQFVAPKFAFSGACAGCGETAYIKLLTQLFGDHIMIANATGCSSIYGGSAPSMPYSIPWANSLFEDNAEYGYGLLIGNNVIKNRIRKIMEENMESSNKEAFSKWLENPDDYTITKEVYDSLDEKTLPKELKELKDYIVKRSIWTIGGDGWAYDIGYSGIDHVLASNDDVNILVLDSQVYSNTGGQSSKASPKGAIAAFATSGKKTNQKDLARMALAYPNVFVAQVSIGANMQQVVRAFREAEEHKGPSIIIAYTPCISHGIEGGMVNSLEMEKLAVKCGYFPIFRYLPSKKEFALDFKKVDFNQYEDFLNRQTRYKMLSKINPEHALELLEDQKRDSISRFEYYSKLESVK